MPENHRSPSWPVLKSYEGDFLSKIALPLGGIGTGTVSLGGRGDLRDWEVGNRPAKGFVPPNSFFVLRTQAPDSAPVVRALEGPLDVAGYEGDEGAVSSNHGLPRFENCVFEAAYPLGQVHLSDRDVPVAVTLQAFNPFIPTDSRRSGWPVAVLRFVLTNTGSQTLQTSVCGSVANFIGQDGTNDDAQGNFNEFRREAGLSGLFLTTKRPDTDGEAWGSMALVSPDEADVSHRTAWAKRSWGDSLLDFWDDLSEDGALEDRDGEDERRPVASLCLQTELAPGETKSLTFLICWHFPNRRAWSAPASEICGNFYTTRWPDAWEVARQIAPQLAELESETLRFVRSFCASDLPATVKEAALFNLSTLRSQTCFQTPDGHFFGWEGCRDRHGSCFGSCTHVWNYESATAHLFGDLARSMREIEFLHATRANGLMSFRVHLPLENATQFALAAADGQMGCLLKLLREWRMSGDDDWLRNLWPGARRALEFCWIEGGWDADADGVMEGCQHNTMDVEYYGPNPQMQSWYLAALRAAQTLARYLGEDDFADYCGALYENGARWTDENLWNGDYYEHQIRPPANAEAIAPGLRHENMGARDLAEPELQLGAGCLIDQLAGQVLAHQCGLGHILSPAHVKTTLHSVVRYNAHDNLRGHFNHMRSFALGDEAAVTMASYPKGRRPARPFPYYNEVMTGFEYTLAAGLMQEGYVAAGVKIIGDIRARYDGRKRNPFDEAECGHHYARAMASWSAVLALTGFDYYAHSQTLRFAPSDAPATWFWSNGNAWGELRQSPAEIELSVLGGAIELSKVEVGARRWQGKNRTLQAGEQLTFA